MEIELVNRIDVADAQGGLLLPEQVSQLTIELVGMDEYVKTL